MDNTNSQTITDPITPSIDPVQLQPPVVTEPTPMTPWQTTTPTPSTSPWQTTPITTNPQIEPTIQAPWQTAQTTNTVTTEAIPVAQVITAAPMTTPVYTTNAIPTNLAPKKGFSPVIMAVAMMFLVAGAVGGTYFVSRGVSTTAPIAPNAPASEPKAFDPTEENPTVTVTPPIDSFDPNGTVDCTNFPNTAQYGNRCVDTVTTDTGEVVWAPGAIESLE